MLPRSITYPLETGNKRSCVARIVDSVPPKSNSLWFSAAPWWIDRPTNNDPYRPKGSWKGTYVSCEFPIRNSTPCDAQMEVGLTKRWEPPQSDPPSSGTHFQGLPNVGSSQPQLISMTASRDLTQARRGGSTCPESRGIIVLLPKLLRELGQTL